MHLHRANFFWHGSSLSMQEYVCISSFIRNGFEVHVYSYSDLELPDGALLNDASEILPASCLGKYTQAGISGNIAAFSDAFRYHVVKKKGGWWFDTDVLCLAKVEQFAQLVINKEIKVSAGYQSPDIIACGVLYLGDPHVVGKVIDELEKAGNEFEWGKIGPTLITRVLKEAELSHLVEPEECFYPIPYTEFRRMYEPASAEWCRSRIKGSLAVHLWNEVRRRDLIPNAIMPPTGSFLYSLFVEFCPELGKKSSIPFETIQALFDYSDLREKNRRIVIEYTRLSNFENEVKNNFIISLLLFLASYFKKEKKC